MACPHLIAFVILITTCSAIDIPSALYRLQRKQAGEDSEDLNIKSIVLSNMPPQLADRLADLRVNWQDISPIAQRALLWDTGLVLAGEGEIVQVYVACGSNMNSAFLSTHEINATTKCPLRTCPKTDQSFASITCDIASVQSVAKCAIQDDVSINSTSTLYAERPEALTSVSDFYVEKYHAPSARRLVNASDAFMFTINQQPSLKFRTEESCPEEASFVVPCTQRVMENKDEWCLPIQSELVNLWIRNEASNTSNPDGGKIPTTVVRDRATSSPAVTYIAILACLLALLLFSTTYLLLHLHRNRNKGESWNSALTLCRLRDSQSPSGDRESRGSSLSYSPHGDKIFDLESMRIPRSTDYDTVLEENWSSTQSSLNLASFNTDAELMKKWVPFSKLTFDSVLARGAHGEVWRGKYVGRLVAIKTLLPEKQHDKEAVAQFAREIRLASSLDHPNIVSFICLSWKNPRDLCSVSEFMAQGDLSSFISSDLSSSMCWTSEKLSIAIDIAEALVYLHSLCPLIIHRDLKSLNVLLNDELRAKLSDFGLSRKRSTEETMTSGIGTLLWTAPEILRGEAYDERSDVFSFGVVLSELDTCMGPYALNDEVRTQQLTSMHLMHLVTQGKIKPVLRGDCPRSIRSLVSACISVDPSERPSAMEIAIRLKSRLLPMAAAIHENSYQFD